MAQNGIYGMFGKLKSSIMKAKIKQLKIQVEELQSQNKPIPIELILAILDLVSPLFENRKGLRARVSDLEDRVTKLEN